MRAEHVRKELSRMVEKEVRKILPELIEKGGGQL